MNELIFLGNWIPCVCIPHFNPISLGRCFSCLPEGLASVISGDDIEPPKLAVWLEWLASVFTDGMLSKCIVLDDDVTPVRIASKLHNCSLKEFIYCHGNPTRPGFNTSDRISTHKLLSPLRINMWTFSLFGEELLSTLDNGSHFVQN